VNILLATGNVGKAREFEAMLGGHARVESVGPGFTVEEDGTTFFQNALKKAQAARAIADPNVLVLADDSGLAVHHLGGRPGVHSARFAGPDASDEDNCSALLRALDGVDDRRAAFVCVLVGIAANQVFTVACGTCSGDIAHAQRGSHGFGYDPLFVPTGMTHAMAELLPEQKHAISHRGRAVRRFAAQMGLTA
jgi:XTP/dITP diphosphohydrolase